MCSRWSAEDAKTVREMIFKENEFINHRLTWLGTFQGLLFAALVFALQKEPELIRLLGVIGIVASTTSLASLWIASKAVKNLRSEWDIYKPFGYAGPDVIGYRSKLFGFLFPWFVLPMLFIVTWSLVLAMFWNQT